MNDDVNNHTALGITPVSQDKGGPMDTPYQIFHTGILDESITSKRLTVSTCRNPRASSLVLFIQLNLKSTHWKVRTLD